MSSASDREIASAVAAAGGATVSGLGLRFDRVAVRVLDRLRGAVEAERRTGVSVVATLTAPLRAPARTATALAQEIGALVRTGAPGEGRRPELHGVRAELRLVEHPPRRGHSLLGFVHNPDVDAATILDLAERWLRSSD